jgi:hypothetical protein
MPISLPPPSLAAMFRTRLLRDTERLINRNPHLYGPGPVARMPSGIGAMDPLKGLVTCAAQGLAVGLAGGFFYKFFIGDPGIQKIEDYYKENPPR